MRGRAEFAVEDVEEERDSMVETRTVSRDGDTDKPVTPEEVDEIGRRRERDPFRHSRRHDRGGGQQGCGGGAIVAEWADRKASAAARVGNP